MPSGSCQRVDDLPGEARAIIDDARRAFLSTVDGAGHPHCLPVCFAVKRLELVSALDYKPKSGRRLQRVRNLERDPRATLLFDAWSEDWSEVGWVMVRGGARLEDPGYGDAELGRRYPQYAARPPEGRVIVLSPKRIVWWTGRE